MRSTVLKNQKAAIVLRAIERRQIKKIEFVQTKGTSEWRPDENIIAVSREPRFSIAHFFNGRNWPDRLLFHELGHAFLDTFKDKIDRKKFRQIFNGPPIKYDAGGGAILTGLLKGNVAVTRYGKAHPEEAFAEAFSFVICNVEDIDLDEKQIQQLSYVDWVLGCLRREKRRWGTYRDYFCEVECSECGDVFDLGPCRRNLDVRGWEAKCPNCEETVEIV